jgi:hypothetical protein
MNPVTESAFFDELTKIGEDAGTPAHKANNLFGLPLEVPKRGKKVYEEGSAAKSADPSQSPIDAQSTANIAAGNRMSPATGPGGV